MHSKTNYYFKLIYIEYVSRMVSPYPSDAAHGDVQLRRDPGPQHRHHQPRQPRHTEHRALVSSSYL